MVIAVVLANFICTVVGSSWRNRLPVRRVLDRANCYVEHIVTESLIRKFVTHPFLLRTLSIHFSIYFSSHLFDPNIE
jgi:hypothetical protein